MKNYCVNSGSAQAENNLKYALWDVLGGKAPIIVCIGTDAVQGDSLGPLVGSLLKQGLQGKAYVFGTLENPITAKEVDCLRGFLSEVYPLSSVLAIDAALGKREEIGAVKVTDCPIKPGLGVDKDLALIGNASIIGIVEERALGKNLLNSVRLSLVFNQATVIANAIKKYFQELASKDYSQRKTI